jgi:hypothetical protein
MEWIDALAAWAWNRHHNVLSWYIRSLHLVPALIGLTVTDALLVVAARMVAQRSRPA